MNEQDLNEAFERVLNSDRRLLTTRQQLWTAFKAGADHALSVIRVATGQTPVLDRKVTVCSVCERACCWQGSFMCDYAETASTKELTVRDLHEKPRGENAEYWFKNGEGVIDRRALEAFRLATTS